MRRPAYGETAQLATDAEHSDAVSETATPHEAGDLLGYERRLLAARGETRTSALGVVSR